MYANVAQGNCLDESHQLVNPLEWTLAAESLLWFNDRWPAYMQSYPQNSQINDIIEQGENLIDAKEWDNKTKEKVTSLIAEAQKNSPIDASGQYTKLTETLKI